MILSWISFRGSVVKALSFTAVLSWLHCYNYSVCHSCSFINVVSWCLSWMAVMLSNPAILPVMGIGIAGHNRRWIDGSIPILSIDTVDHADHRYSSIDRRSQNTCQSDDHRSFGSLSTYGTDPLNKNRFPYHRFLNEGEPSKYSSTIACASYDRTAGMEHSEQDRLKMAHRTEWQESSCFFSFILSAVNFLLLFFAVLSR